MLFVAALVGKPVMGQLIDRTTAPNAANEGIAKSFEEQIGAGRGDANTPGSSLYIINRDPARAIRRGRQLFQRKFTRALGQGPVTGDGAGNPQVDRIIGAGLMDSCAGCHGRPRGSAGFGGLVVTRPDSRDAPNLFGLGLKEMLADQITDDLRDIREDAIDDARDERRTVTRRLRVSVGNFVLDYGLITAFPNGTVDTSRVEGVNPDLRIRPFFVIRRHGGEAQQARDNFVALGSSSRAAILAFLNSLILFSPDDTPSNLAGGGIDPANPRYPQFGHGSIRLTALFLNPNDPE